MTVPMLPGSRTSWRYSCRCPPGSAQRSRYTPMTRVPDPSSLAPSRSSGSTSRPATSTNSAWAPAASAASTRSSPSATNSPERSRCFRALSLRISLSFSLCGLVIIWTKKAARVPQAAREWSMEPSRLSRGGLPGSLGKSAERLRIVHGEIRQHLAVDLDPGLVQAVDELRVAHALAPRGGVDPDDPKAPEVALSVAPVAVGVAARAHDLLVGEAVARMLPSPVAPGLLEDLLLAALAGDGIGCAGHG